ncbi:MATH domain-containing protein [Panicum miliaceum]|uniref:MATH domain-containing protein n=1 Tax=Panicum miliaceum TaxID=4540 RepID=A0A3L6QY44_PANMI|nr:MATH domain-containing protein [Panicum miliaceum]
MSNIEQIYRRFVEERRCKLIRLIDDKWKWSSFRAFWLAIDPTTKHRMSREKSDTILKMVVKHFFLEKEVTSTLVMDALYTGLKALEGHSNGKKGTVTSMDLEDLPAPMVHVDMDMFVLAGDFISLLERAALEPLSCQSLSPKDDKCSQSRAKDGGGSGEVNKVPIEREERRLTGFGQKIIETFVLSHIFSGVEVAYKEDVALKRQEELIREEELLENEKGKRGSANEKDKRAKKKQAKQKKNSRKVKDKERVEKSDSNFLERGRDGSTNHDRENSKHAGLLAAKPDNSGDGASDMSDNVDGSIEVCQTDTCDKITQPVNAMNDVGREMKNVQACEKETVDIESLVTSVSATVSSIRGKINNLLDSTSHITRGRSRRNRVISSIIASQYEDDLPSSSCSDRNTYGCGPAPRRDQETALLTLKDRLRELGQRLHEKEIEGRELLKAHLEKKAAAEAAAGSSSSDSLEKTPQVRKGPVQSLVTVNDGNSNAPASKSLPVATSGDSTGAVPATATSTINTKSVPITPTPTAPKSPATQVDTISQHNSVSRQIPSTSISKAREDTDSERVVATSVPRTETPKPTSRPTSAPLFQAPSSTPPTPSVQVSPLLSHSLTVSERPRDEPSPSAPIISQAYRNAFLGKGSLNTTSSSHEQSTSIGQYTAVSQPLSAYALATSVMASPTERNEQLPGKQSYMFGPSKSEALDNWHLRKGNSDVNKHTWKDDIPNQQITNCNVHVHPVKDISYQQLSTSAIEQGRLGGLQYRQFQSEMPASFVSYQQQGPVGEEFPHIDIINDLLDEDQSSACMAASPLHEYHTFGLPFSTGGNMADSEMASISSFGRFNSTDHYYDESYLRAYDTQNAMHRLRDGQLSTLDVYSNGRLDTTAPKPWPYSHSNPAVNHGINSNAFSQRIGDYTNLANGRVNGEYSEYLYRRANRQW